MEPWTPLTLATAGHGRLGGALLDHETVGEELRRDLAESPSRPDSAPVSSAELFRLRPPSQGNLPSRRGRLSP